VPAARRDVADRADAAGAMDGGGPGVRIRDVSLAGRRASVARDSQRHRGRGNRVVVRWTATARQQQSPVAWV